MFKKALTLLLDSTDYFINTFETLIFYMNRIANELGTEKISKLLLKLAVPASIGFLIMSLNMIIDTIFVGRWIGILAIAAITVVLPIAFFI